MTLLDRIRTAKPGTRVSLLSPCGDGCSSAESIGDVEELQAVIGDADSIIITPVCPSSRDFDGPDGKTYRRID